MTAVALSTHLQAHPVRQPGALSAPVMKKIDQASQSFEGMFMSQMMSFMWSDTSADPNFGGGHAEDMWRGMMTQEMGKIAGQRGGLGVADAVRAEMIKLQQTHAPDNATPNAQAAKNLESAQ